MQKIIEEYKNNGHKFLLQAFGSSKYLEDLSGITDLMTAQHAEVNLSLFDAFVFDLLHINSLLSIFQVLEFNDSDFDLSD